MKKIFEGRKGFAILAIIASVILSVTILISSFVAGLGENKPGLGKSKQPVASQVHKISLYPPVQGLYESCAPSKGSFCLNRLKLIASAGFTLVVNYDQLFGHAEQQLAYANEAHSLGMKVIWGMSDPAFWNGTDLLSYYKDLAATCMCSDNNGFIRYVVSFIKNLPATWGYYVGDEVNSGDHARMKAFADLIKQLDPFHPRLFISGENPPTMGASLEPFVDTAEYIGSDIYPVGTSEPIAEVGSVARSIQSIADQNGKQSVIVLQAFNWSQYSKTSQECFSANSCNQFPTVKQMRQMRDLAVSNSHPQFLLWYSFFDLVRSDDALVHWLELVAAMEVPISSDS